MVHSRWISQSLRFAVLTALSTLAGFAAAATVEDAVYEELLKSDDGRSYVIVMLKPVPMRPKGELAIQMTEVATVQDRVLGKLDSTDFELVYKYGTFAGMTGRVTATGLGKLAADGDVTAIGVDGRGSAQSNVSMPYIGANVAHSAGYTGQNATVAVLDSGIDSSHPDLSSSIAPGAWHFLNQGATTGPGAPDPWGHGTNVSGIITSDNATYKGVAPDADILAVRVLDSVGSGWLSDWTAGVDYVTQNAANYFYLCAINMSLGSFTLFDECPCDNTDVFNQALGAAISAAHVAGIATFSSSGNAGFLTTMSSPACLTDAVAVAAVYDQNLGREPNAGTYQSNFGSSFGNCFDASTFGDLVTCFSNRSSCNELAAPGRLITSTGTGGGLSTWTGTSQASPHAAGLAALICERIDSFFVRLGPQEIIDAMKNTGLPVTDAGSPPHPVRITSVPALSEFQPSNVSLNGTIQPPGQVSIMIVPDGTGTPLAQAMAWNGVAGTPPAIVNANVAVTVFGPNAQPLPFFPATSVILDPPAAVVLCANHGADADTDIVGQTTISGSPKGGGFSNPASDLAQINVVGASVNGSIPTVDVQFNSPDIDANLVVNLGDVGPFSADIVGPYNYRSDFFWDGKIDLADIGPFSGAIGAVCADCKTTPVAKTATEGHLEWTFSETSPLPGEPFEAYLRVSADFLSEGIEAWEASVSWSDNIQIESWQLTPLATNFRTAPDFVVGLGGTRVSKTGSQHLLTVGLHVTDGAPAWIGLRAASLQSTGVELPAVAIGGKNRRLANVSPGASGSQGRTWIRQLPPAQSELARTAPSFLENVPNPFNPRTEIRFGLPATATAEVRIYDVGGRLIRSLGGSRYEAGEHALVWDGTNLTGRPVASGIYFARLVVAGRASDSIRKMTLAR